MIVPKPTPHNSLRAKEIDELAERLYVSQQGMDARTAFRDAIAFLKYRARVRSARFKYADEYALPMEGDQ